MLPRRPPAPSAEGADTGHRIAQPPGDQRLRRGPGVRGLAGQHLVEHAGETVHVAPGIGVPLAHGLLRTHVGGRAQREPGPREALAPVVHRRQGDPEVADHRVAGLEQDVLGLDVAVNHAAPVGEFQGIGHGAR